MFLSKKEVKIFLTFFILYSFFVYWGGWNEQSHFALTRSIVDEGRFEIDSYANQTADRSFYDGHYYSDKDPGLSFLATPVYASWKFIYYSIFPKDFQEKYAGGKEYITAMAGINNVTIIDYADPGYFILTSMILVTIFTSSLFSALLIVLIYELSKYFTKNEKYRLLLTFTAGLGTMIFPYALVFMQHAIETFFAFLAFYLLFKVKQDKIKEDNYFILAGLSLGISITSSIISVIIGVACLFYIFSFRREKIFHFIIGGFVGILPFLFYNYLSFGALFTLPRHYLDSNIWPELGGIKGLGIPNLFVIIRLVFDSYKGIFFYYPILFISFLGLYYMRKKFKIESMIIFFISVSYLVMNSSWWAWWGAGCFGPRHLTPIMPFLILPLIFILEKYNKGLIKYLIFILIFYSIFVNFASIQTVSGVNDIIGKDKVTIDSLYKEKINSFELIKNPIYEYYIPLFLEFGSRSRIFENIMNGELSIDIRNLPISKGASFPFVNFYIPFLSLISILVILTILWNKEFVSSIKNIHYKWIFIFFVIFSLILFFIIKSNSSIVLSQGWHPQLPNENGRWMIQNGSILIFNNQTEKLFLLKTIISSYYIDREIIMYLNYQPFDNFTVYNNSFFENSWLLYLKSGKNLITFASKQDCYIPNLKNRKEEDYRCISLNLEKIDLENLKSENIIFSKNWYPLERTNDTEHRFMSKNAECVIYNPSKSKDINISFTVKTFYKKRTLDIIFNNDTRFTYVINDTERIINKVKLLEGINKIVFKSVEGCDTPVDLGINPDKRCLSFTFYDFKVDL